jgi:hypothetical protein
VSDLTQKLIERLADKAWRMRNLYVILDEQGETVAFIPRQEQESFFANRHSRNIVPKARKLGMSTGIVIDYLDECIFNKNRFCAHIDRTRDDAEAKLAIARFAWENGPKHPNKGIAEIWRGIHERVKLTKNNDGEMEWSNGSAQRAAVSLTGRTPHRLHISEYGPIAAQEPARAAEIKRGSINAVPIGGVIDIETTMEGGPFGECYEIFSEAMGNGGKDLASVEWRMHFFPWFNHPSYVLPGRKPDRPQTLEYFEKLQREHAITILADRQAWYEATWKTQRENMWSQFPSTPAECVKVPTKGRIYEHMATIRTEGRVKEFAHERSLPIITGWDLGVSDFMSGWAVQFAGREVLWLAWWEAEGEGAASVANVIRQWEAMFGQKMEMNLLPHDADRREIATGKTFRQVLVESGVSSTTVRVVPRTPDIWVGINAMRDLLPKSYFHSRCDEPRTSQSGSKLPSGVACLENYRKKPDSANGTISESPVHDLTSHTADAARTIAEAWQQQLLANVTRHAPKFTDLDPWGQPRKRNRGQYAGDFVG